CRSKNSYKLGEEMKKRNFNHIELYIGAVIIGLIALMAIISLFYTPYDPNKMDLVNKFQTPSALHLLGTDQFGRDVLSRIMVGSKLIFLVGVSSVGIALIIGTTLGALGGYYGGLLDDLLMKVIEANLAFPGVLLALMLISIFSPSIWIIILALSIMNTPRFTRVVRSGYIQYKHAEFVEAARVTGISDLRIILVHILPNISSSILVTSALSFGTSILSEAGLSYLGLGLQPPHASWGKMLNESQGFMLQSPLTAIIPGVLITLIVLGFNLIADGLRKKL
ncbi:MAG: ABC transporter permease, partial [Cellulosilyticaceae bacterium]